MKLDTDRILSECYNEYARPCVYFIRNIQNGKRYVGSTRNAQRRLYEHIKQLRSNSHSSRYLQNAVNKDGIENFRFEVFKFYRSDIKTKTLRQNEQVLIDERSEYNMSKTAEVGFSRRGENGLRANFTNQQVRKAKQMMLDGFMYHEIEERTGIPRKDLCGIRRGDTWKSVTVKGERKLRGLRMYKPEKHNKAKLTSKDVKCIVERIITGDSYQSIANRYNVNKSTIYSIAKEKTWKNVKKPAAFYERQVYIPRPDMVTHE